MKETGTVKWFKKSYGFITGDNGTDYFVHFSDIICEGFKTLEAEQRVSFVPTHTERGDQAVEVEAI